MTRSEYAAIADMARLTGAGAAPPLQTQIGWHEMLRGLRKLTGWPTDTRASDVVLTDALVRLGREPARAEQLWSAEVDPLNCMICNAPWSSCAKCRHDAGAVGQKAPLHPRPMEGSSAWRRRSNQASRCERPRVQLTAACRLIRHSTSARMRAGEATLVDQVDNYVGLELLNERKGSASAGTIQVRSKHSARCTATRRAPFATRTASRRLVRIHEDRVAFTRKASGNDLIARFSRTTRLHAARFDDWQILAHGHEIRIDEHKELLAPEVL